jgi:two-component system sensor histidine kinase VicK
MVCIAVHDDGIGIPMEQRLRVFQPFVRLRSIDTPGSGIGLAIIQRIVTLYGGHVWIEGEEGQGCTVKFTLPWLRSDLDGVPVEPAQIEVGDLSKQDRL